MPRRFDSPGVFVEPQPALPPAIEGVATAITAFIGSAQQGPVNRPVTLRSYAEFERVFAGAWHASQLPQAVRDFFAHGGRQAVVVRLHSQPVAMARTRQLIRSTGVQAFEQALHALDPVPHFNLLCMPPFANENGALQDVPPAALAAATLCCERRGAVHLIDAPSSWLSAEDARRGMASGAMGTSPNAALYFPRLRSAASFKGQRLEQIAPCGAVAGLIARTDALRGVWKAPAGQEMRLTGYEPSLPVSTRDQDELVAWGVNPLRTFPGVGSLVWGARTLAARNDTTWRHLSVRRTALFIEQSVRQALQWAGAAPNEERTRLQMRVSTETFMHSLFLKGAFPGSKPELAYFVRCDAAPPSRGAQAQGGSTVTVGFAPLRAAEFVVINIRLPLGQPPGPAPSPQE